jgi:peptidoglycan/LPS O-acetylase OafA/YrhL
MRTVPSGPTLEERFDPRRNCLTVMRLALALTVLLVHAQAIGLGSQPFLGRAQLGDVAVDAFFVLSGFLVTRSALRLGSARRFAWHRALRILPGFWVCLLVTAFAVAPLIAWVEGTSLPTLWGEHSAVEYVWRNSALLMRQFGIGELLADSPERGVLDGSLWTLYYEGCCYGVIAALMLLGVLRRSRVTARVVIAALTVLTWLVVIAVSAELVAGPGRLPEFLLMFLFGALGWLHADRLPTSGGLAVAAVAACAVGFAVVPNYRAAIGPALAYLCLWAIVSLPATFAPRSDLSYGVYIYHWPVQQVLAPSVPSIGWAGFALMSTGLTIAAAVASWRLVEAPALRHKDAAWVERQLVLVPARRRP